MTSGQGHVIIDQSIVHWSFVLINVGHIVISRCVYAGETHWDHSQRSISILSKVRGETMNLTSWPRMTRRRSRCVKTAHGSLKVAQYLQEYLEINSTFPLVPSKKRHLNIFPLPYNGQVQEMSWPQVTDIEIPRYTFYRYWCRYQLMKVSYWCLKNCSHGVIINIFRGRVTLPDLATWPKVTSG